MDVGISYIYERLFIDLVLPFTVFAAWLSLLCSIVAYIVHKMAKNDPKISFKTKLKNCYKWGLSIYLILIVIVLLLVPIFPQEIFHYENITYSHLNRFIHSLNIDNCILHHKHIWGMSLSFISSLILLAYGFQHKIIERLGKLQLVLYLVISTPLIYGLILLVNNFSILTVIVIIGLPGALLSFLI